MYSLTVEGLWLMKLRSSRYINVVVTCVTVHRWRRSKSNLNLIRFFRRSTVQFPFPSVRNVILSWFSIKKRLRKRLLFNCIPKPIVYSENGDKDKLSKYKSY
jgi:hypothetical protein